MYVGRKREQLSTFIIKVLYIGLITQSRNFQQFVSSIVGNENTSRGHSPLDSPLPRTARLKRHPPHTVHLRTRQSVGVV